MILESENMKKAWKDLMRIFQKELKKKDLTNVAVALGAIILASGNEINSSTDKILNCLNHSKNNELLRATATFIKRVRSEIRIKKDIEKIVTEIGAMVLAAVNTSDKRIIDKLSYLLEEGE